KVSSANCMQLSPLASSNLTPLVREASALLRLPWGLQSLRCSRSLGKLCGPRSPNQRSARRLWQQQVYLLAATRQGVARRSVVVRTYALHIPDLHIQRDSPITVVGNVPRSDASACRLSEIASLAPQHAAAIRAPLDCNRSVGGLRPVPAVSLSIAPNALTGAHQRPARRQLLWWMLARCVTAAAALVEAESPLAADDGSHLLHVYYD